MPGLLNAPAAVAVDELDGDALLAELGVHAVGADPGAIDAAAQAAIKKLPSSTGS